MSVVYSPDAQTARGKMDSRGKLEKGECEGTIPDEITGACALTPLHDWVNKPKSDSPGRPLEGRGAALGKVFDPQEVGLGYTQ